MAKNQVKRTPRMIRRTASIALVLLLGTAFPGCGDEEPSEVVSYTDSAGRSCTVDLWDITLTAMCDVDPSTIISCEGGQEPALVLHNDYDFDTMISTRQSCTACVDHANHQTYIGTCANVECTTDDDCLNSEGEVTPYTCGSGICTRS